MANDTELSLDEEEQPCLKCGGPTDTGWECTECGYDNRDWYLSTDKIKLPIRRQTNAINRFDNKA